MCVGEERESTRWRWLNFWALDSGDRKIGIEEALKSTSLREGGNDGDLVRYSNL